MQTMTYQHAAYTDGGATYEATGIAYPALEEVGPAKFRNECREDVAEGDDAFGCRRWDEVQCSG